MSPYTPRTRTYREARECVDRLRAPFGLRLRERLERAPGVGGRQLQNCTQDLGGSVTLGPGGATEKTRHCETLTSVDLDGMAYQLVLDVLQFFNQDVLFPGEKHWPLVPRAFADRQTHLRACKHG